MKLCSEKIHISPKVASCRFPRLPATATATAHHDGEVIAGDQKPLTKVA